MAVPQDFYFYEASKTARCHMQAHIAGKAELC